VSTTTTPTSGSPVTTAYRVAGMTCGHCVAAVDRELRTLAGVLDAHVDLAAGEATVTSLAPLATDDVAAAVEEAGYALVR
jgi:copper chaperone CopZ